MYKVLLADDEMLDLEGMRTFIPWEELGMEVMDAVNSGFAACGVLESRRVDILVTDIRMPNMTGLELAGKALERQADLSIIFVSGHQDFHYVKQAMAMNAFGYVLKPMDDKELIDSLNKARVQLDLKNNRQQAEASPDAKLHVHGMEHSKNGKLIGNIASYIQHRLHESITLRDLGRHFSFSPNYLGFLFKEETGQNFCDYVNKLRMEKAKQLLSESGLKIYEIAEQVGYRYFPYFCRQFKETVGMTPLEYRRKH